MTTVTTVSIKPKLEKGLNPFDQVALYLAVGHAVVWLFLLIRWMMFSSKWTPFAFESALATLPNIVPYLVYGVGLLADAGIIIGLWRQLRFVRWLGFVRCTFFIVGSLIYFYLTREFYGAVVVLGLAGMIAILLARNAPWSIAYPAAFWLAIFFVIPMMIVLIVSFGERARLGTVTYPTFSFSEIGVYFNDYKRFFSSIGGDYIYLRIFWRSVGMALLNTLFCLLLGYPFAYWIARQPEKYRGLLIFLVMIPFWTNFLVRTYAWMLLLRDSGLINNFWAGSLHDLAASLAGESGFFAWLAGITESKLPLLFNQQAVMLGLVYGFFPFAVLPLYGNLEKMDWSLLEAAADLGANRWHSTIRILLPLSLPGIVAASIVVFIPSLGAYVTPDLLGGAKVSLLGNLLQQQFMTVRDWPFGSAIGFIMMAIMLMATMIYFRTLSQNEALYE